LMPSYFLQSCLVWLPLPLTKSEYFSVDKLQREMF
jgi:hypothetical protein